MDKLVITSMRPNAGKTSIIIGLAKAFNKKVGYIKPFGDRLLYRKKRLWDYDAALIAALFGLDDDPEDMSIGFNHSRLLYILSEESARSKLVNLQDTVNKEKHFLFIESGRDISYGVSVNLDAISMARHLNAPLVAVISGNEETIIDDITFMTNYVNLGGIFFKGFILNKVSNVIDFAESHLPKIKELGVNIIGIIPHYEELTKFSVAYLADRLFAKVITCEAQINRTIHNIFIGSMSVNSARQNPLFHQENKVVITSGDREDMIDISLESNTAAIVLTNNITPSETTIARAEELKIPLLLVTSDTFQIAKQIEAMETLLTRNDGGKIALLEQIIKKHINLKEIF